MGNVYLSILKVDLSQPAILKVAVSPSDADFILSKKNPGNRPITGRHVDFLKSSILMGEWQEDSPQRVLFDQHGNLLDGQHRLSAISASGKTLIVSIECGIDRSLRSYIDIGRSRQLNERLTFVADVSKNQFISRVINKAFMVRHGHQVRITSEMAMIEFRQREDAYIFVSEHFRTHARGVGHAIIAFAFMEGYARNANVCKDFISSFIVPDGVMQQARMLRDWVMLRQRPDQFDLYRRTVYCLKAAFSGTKVSRILSAVWDD